MTIRSLCDPCNWFIDWLNFFLIFLICSFILEYDAHVFCSVIFSRTSLSRDHIATFVKLHIQIEIYAKIWMWDDPKIKKPIHQTHTPTQTIILR